MKSTVTKFACSILGILLPFLNCAQTTCVVEVSQKNNGDRLKDAKVVIRVDSGRADTFFTNQAGKQVFTMKKNHSYVLHAEKEGFLSDDQPAVSGNHLPDTLVLKFSLKRFPLITYNWDFLYHKNAKLPKHIPSVDTLRKILVMNPGYFVKLNGYASCREKAALAKERPMWIKQQLISNGIQKERIKVIPHVDEVWNDCNCRQNSDCTEADYAENRKVRILFGDLKEEK